MAKRRASNKKIIGVKNSMGGELVDTTKNDGDVPVWNQAENTYRHKAANDHDHEIGNMQLIFENSLV